jgi:rod shape-determining protein MreC
MKYFNTDGWVRRLRGLILVLIFITVFLYIFSLNFRSSSKMDVLQRSVTETVSPPLRMFGKIFSGIEELSSQYIWLKNLRSENELLKRQVAELESKVTSYQEAFIENQRLRRLLDFKTSSKAETLPAQVVMHDLTGWFQTLMVDKGFRDGIAPDMPVVNDEGVIGRVLDVSDRHCRVLLITDQGSSVDAVDQRNRVRGILSGKDPNGCLLKYIRSNLDIREGDLVITSGKDGVYPKGLRLGVIQAAYKDPVDLFQKIEVKPFVRLSALEEVLIIKQSGVGLDVEEEGQPPIAGPEIQPPAQASPAAQAVTEPAAGAKPVAKLPATAASKSKTVTKPQPAVRTRTSPHPQTKPAAQVGTGTITGAKPVAKPPAAAASKSKTVTKPQSTTHTRANQFLGAPPQMIPRAKSQTRPLGNPQPGSQDQANPRNAGER